MSNEDRLNAIWKQNSIPVAYRRQGKGHKLLVKLPWANDNRVWLKNRRRSNPTWQHVEKHWELPASWFNDFVDRSLHRFKRVYIIQPYRAQEKCSPACQNARGHICQCSCMGEYHGVGNDGSWFEVNDRFSTRWAEQQEVACRLLIDKRS